jgi:hypothetical protein
MGAKAVLGRKVNADSTAVPASAQETQPTKPTNNAGPTSWSRRQTQLTKRVGDQVIGQAAREAVGTKAMWLTPKGEPR